jgi:hypothetical protein
VVVRDGALFALAGLWERWYDPHGKVYIRSAEVRDIQSFARMWDRNLKAQGFMDAANNHDGR